MVEPRRQRSFICFLSTLFLLAAAFFIVTDYKEVKYTFSSIITTETILTFSSVVYLVCFLGSIILLPTLTNKLDICSFLFFFEKCYTNTLLGKLNAHALNESTCPNK
jgi:hypothetical protein